MQHRPLSIINPLIPATTYFLGLLIRQAWLIKPPFTYSRRPLTLVGRMLQRKYQIADFRVSCQTVLVICFILLKCWLQRLSLDHCIQRLNVPVTVNIKGKKRKTNINEFKMSTNLKYYYLYKLTQHQRWRYLIFLQKQMTQLNALPQVVPTPSHSNHQFPDCGSLMISEYFFLSFRWHTLIWENLTYRI